MAIVKFVASGCPMNNIFGYVMREEATERKLIDGIMCTPETALEEFKFVKVKFGKEDGRQYYHIVQSFSPDDKITPETAHEIGMKFAAYFKGYQALVATHTNRDHLHNHIILNSVNYENGYKYHQSRDDMLQDRLPLLDREICSLKENVANVGRFLESAKRYTVIRELTPDILRTFISKIVIHEREKGHVKRSSQRIDICFRFIGNVFTVERNNCGNSDEDAG
ncbi:MAG: relaxase/mobilization nuclease domain-containing protein [Clostridia bacterium]|nr:relaxase/mobilization nuclease domain-containing protein [Clostridia bacterium]